MSSACLSSGFWVVLLVKISTALKLDGRSALICMVITTQGCFSYTKLKWKDIVDEWVKLNPPAGHETSALMVDGDSPQQKISQNGHHQVPNFAYSPNPQNGSSGSDKNNSEPERKPQSVILARRETPIKPPQSAAPHVPQSVQRLSEQQRAREQKESNSDSERLALAKKGFKPTTKKQKMVGF
ncbi:hypothetical protein Q3G72_017599 [Acer saccharum]|nr:hypothetical protein Q3G72_017599 [Acer saccharum]